MDQTQKKQLTIQYRYPGTHPFTADYRDLFFGRDEDVERLSQLCSLEGLIILYGKSGLGKTSLLNAGVVPLLQKEENYEAFDVRFGSYVPESDNNPTEILCRKISDTASYDNFLWNKVLNIPDQVKTLLRSGVIHSEIPESLWCYFKSLQIQNNGGNSFLIVFDQFEELFTYPDTFITIFAKELSELLNVKTPQYIRDLIKKRLEIDKDFISREEMQTLYTPMNIKVLISIRSDRMCFLNRLKIYLPDILNQTYELQPLEISQARAAILRPAEKEGNFASHTFQYEKNTLDEIVNYLSNNGKQKIETFQLQFLCHYAENVVLNSKEKQMLVKEDFGDFDTIFERHYNNIIEEISEGHVREAVRTFIEDHLIIEGCRVALPELVITSEHNISVFLLKQLVNTRILRSEPNTTGHFSYEISHDTLVSPILEAGRLRREIEKVKRVERERREEIRIMREKQKLKIIVGVTFAAIISIGFAIWGFVQKNHQRMQVLRAVELLETMKPEGVSNLYKYFRKNGIKCYKMGDYGMARIHFKSANLSPDVPTSTDLKVWLYNIEKCEALGLQANDEIYKGNFAEAQKISEEIITINESSVVNKCRLAMCKLFTEQLVSVQGGTFQIGIVDGESNEKPVRSVRLDDFSISKYEVTNNQYAHFLNQYGSDQVRKGDYKGKPMISQLPRGVIIQGKVWVPQAGFEKHPVVGVSWFGANEFCRYYGGSLPTEAQWEYAARSGGEDELWSGIGNEEKSDQEELWSGVDNEEVLKEYAWYTENSENTTHPVGIKEPNGIGVYDMSGNVYEWCYDWYVNYNKNVRKNHYGINVQKNHSEKVRYRNARGGGWSEDASCCRTTYRYKDYPEDMYNDLGFRFYRAP